jgi:hypothetical protein
VRRRDSENESGCLAPPVMLVVARNGKAALVLGILLRDAPLPNILFPLVRVAGRSAFAMPDTRGGLVGIGHTNAIDSARQQEFAPRLEQPCGGPRIGFILKAPDTNVLGPSIRIGPFDQYFVRRECEVPVCKMDREAAKFAVPRENVADFGKTIEIAVVYRRNIVQVCQSRPLHRRD